MSINNRILAIIAKHRIQVPPERLLVLDLIDAATLSSTLRQHTLPYKDQEWRMVTRKEEAAKLLESVGIVAPITPELTEDVLSLAIDLNQLSV